MLQVYSPTGGTNGEIKGWSLERESMRKQGQVPVRTGGVGHSRGTVIIVKRGWVWKELCFSVASVYSGIVRKGEEKRGEDGRQGKDWREEGGCENPDLAPSADRAGSTGE